MRWTGTKHVIEFNWPMILGGAAATLVGALLWRRLPALGKAATLAAGWQTGASLVGTWWAYDASGHHEWRFPATRSKIDPASVLLVTAGFDDVSEALRAAHPRAKVTVVDILSDEAAEEPSIRRARRRYPAAAPYVDPAALGEVGTFDLVILAESIHELRSHEGRTAAIAGALDASKGAVVLVEHFRDAPNIVAYGPGAWHFHTRAAWLAAIADAGGRVVDESRVSPFIACVVVTRDDR